MTLCRTGLCLPWLVFGLSCGPRPPLEPNGDQHVLEFDRIDTQGPDPIGEGLFRDLLLPSDFTLVDGCGKLDFVCRTKQLHLDFGDTSLVAQPGPGLRVLEAPLEDSGYRIRVICDQAPDGGSATLDVNIIADGGTRYADSTEVGCERGADLELGRFQLAAVGAEATFSGMLWNQPPGASNRTALGGVGWTLDDAGTVALVGLPSWGFDGVQLSFAALSPGPGGLLHAGTTGAELPVEVLADSDWTLAINVRACSFGGDGGLESLEPTLFGVAPDGGQVLLPTDGCDYTFTDDAGAHVSANQPCGSCTPAFGPGQLCAAFRGKTTCVNVDANGNPR